MLETRSLLGRLLMATGAIILAKSGVDYMVEKSVEEYLKKTKKEEA